jgi:hypothetical protein
MPRCADLVATGLPALSVSLVTFNDAGGERRPYVVGLTGDPLRVELRRVCGDAAAALVH